MSGDILLENLVSPITLAFLLGVLARLIKSDLEIPEPVMKIFSVFLLFSIGLQGGQELAKVAFADIAAGLGVTLVLVLALPGLAYLTARWLIGLDIRNAAGIAALYGSVSSVTFVVSRSYAEAQGTPMDAYVTALVAIMELGMLVALFYGRLALSRDGAVTGSLGAILQETLRGRGIVLLGGGLFIGWAIGDTNFERIEPFFVDLFRGVLVLFLLEMGMAAAAQLRDFARLGPRILGFAIGVPMVNGTLATCVATLAGLDLGSSAVLGAVAASASYIDAPAAVRATFPEANPSIYLTSSLGVTFPFMLILGIPIVYAIAAFWQGLLG
ncbi:sodium-dependent bicarbonate transport family permease [Microvirga tunisiensis]|uniref:Sodium-dependent bicarbonate transport family permease n=2 Tax=Pannonibacter tanglangensis TaxID=2750084 RepID=A0A7X5F254_9HYPH|nr:MULTISPECIES: sodium-dependent bicarbonate transport family permease [unclassified Pannonibacter]NBN62643.1 sodium-dependent bicarbonate transport family permease [Pannonibacter sp. XCT-34]NBN78298.1 sodium-dependent bicarbonate transport family permease [Pannonibacter sp. XCT-53]